MRERIERVILATYHAGTIGTSISDVEEIGTTQILKEITEEIEKVENPCVDRGKYKGLCWDEFEACRQKILALFKGGKHE